MNRVLLLTASFGEGHNTAARNIQNALLATGEIETQLVDLYARGRPFLNHMQQWIYALSINRYPRLWKLAFWLLDHTPLIERSLWTIGRIQREFEQLLADFQPNVVVSTYPLYAFLFRRIQQMKHGISMPLVTFITDSTVINSAWYRCLSDAFIVVDRATAHVLQNAGIPGESVHTLGFPIAPEFEKAPLSLQEIGPPWKLLFMPSTQQDLTIQQIQRLLSLQEVELTVLVGHNKQIFNAIRDTFLKEERCKLLPWTNAMPILLSTHHLFIGKAGGAIVQEAMAAQCPFVVSQLVPGQEEGNIALLERYDLGMAAIGTPKYLAQTIQQIFTREGSLWKRWKTNLATLANPGASQRSACFIVALARKNTEQRKMRNAAYGMRHEEESEVTG